MPSITDSSKVLVTGSNGFIAVETCLQLAEKGYTVVGTVRRPSSGEYLKKLIGDRFSYVIVEDFEKLDAFDQVVKDGEFDGILHMGSPVTFDKKPKEVIGPAVAGTTGILNSVLKFGSTVKRVIITASAAGVLAEYDEPYTFSETDWNVQSPAVVEREGDDSSPAQIYRASKTLAERAAWKFIEDHKSEIGFDLTTILPVLVFGPVKQELSRIEQLNETSSVIYNLMTKPPKPPVKGVRFSGNLVDVRDTALAHILALEKEEAGGERFLASTGPFFPPELRDALLAKNIPGIVPGTSEGYVREAPEIIVDGSKIERVLGLKYRSQVETVVDSINSIRAKFPEASL